MTQTNERPEQTPFEQRTTPRLRVLLQLLALLLFAHLTAILLAGCVGVGSSVAGPRYLSVPLVEYPAEEQALVAARIVAACGDPPFCPGSAVLERWILDYGRERAMIRALDQRRDE